MTNYIRFAKGFESIKIDSSPLSLAGNAFLPPTALIPLRQHAGEDANLIVQSGERVREGQLIARSTSDRAANVHASIPGIVDSFREVPMPDGSLQISAVIKLSGAFDLLGKRESAYPWQNVPESELLRVIEDKGCVNSFSDPVPLGPQLRNAKRNARCTVTLRLFDADPTCRIDSTLYRSFPDIILSGAAIIARSVDARCVYLAHTEKRTAIEALKLDQIFNGRPALPVRSPNRYPSGNERRIRALVSGMEDSKGDGETTILVDVTTALSAYDAVVRNLPCVTRFVEVCGPAIDSPKILKVRVGTPIGDVIEECGGFKVDPARIVVNGLLAGQAVYDLDTPITKYAKSLHLMDRDACPPYTVRECAHCGRCLQVCPAKIDPQRVVASIKAARTSEKLAKSISACQYCGCCAIVCPSRIPLHQIIKEAHSRLTEDRT